MRCLLSCAMLAALPLIAGCTVESSSDDSSNDEPTLTEDDALGAAWQTGGNVGYGVARSDTKNPIGENVFIGYAGYQVSRSAACAWTTALYHATLRAKGVRYLYCVQGPADPVYSQQEIGNSKIVADLKKHVSQKTHFILVAGHSSGSFVAHELLGQLADGLDPGGVTKGKVVYFDLDGGESGLSEHVVKRLRKAYFVGARDNGTDSPNFGTMQSAASAYGTFWENNSNGAGCKPGAIWCVHVSLITTRPHSPWGAEAIPDYSDFNGRPVAHAYIEAKASDAHLEP